MQPSIASISFISFIISGLDMIMEKLQYLQNYNRKMLKNCNNVAA